MGIETIVGLALAAVGTGVSAYGQHQAAKSQASIANYNFAAQQQNAMMQQQAANMQAAALQKQASYADAQASINNALAQSEAQARLNNADSMRSSAEAQAAADRQNIISKQKDFERFTAEQRAAIGASGVVESGSPLDALAESAGNMQASLNESHYQSEITRRKTLGQAGLEEFGGKLAQAGATAQLGAGKAQADMLRTNASLEALKGASAYRSGMEEANIGLMSGLAQSRGSQLGSYATLASGAAGMANQWNSWRYSGAIGGGSGYKTTY
jgi:hypothetical protein